MIKLKIRNLKGEIIHSNLGGVYPLDIELINNLLKFLNLNNISYRTRNDWLKKTKNGWTGTRYLNYITFYKREDVNLFRLVFNDKVKIEEIMK